MCWSRSETLLIWISIAFLASSCNGEHAEESGAPPRIFFSHPQDGQLYAGLACTDVTPTQENHPGPHYMAGTDGNRLAEGTHDPLEACALLLGKDDDTLALVSVDAFGLLAPRAQRMKDRLQGLGIDPERVFVSSTHTHTGPDTVGLYGPSFVQTGLDWVYQEALVDGVVEAVTAAQEAMVPVTATFATGAVEVPGSNCPSLIRDSRDPQVVDPRLHAIRFDNAQAGTVATLVNFANHAEVAIFYDLYSADFPHYLRERLVMEYGGGAIYFPGAIGGLATPLDVSTPARDEEGNPIYEGGEPVWWSACTWEKTRSYGYVLAEIAIELLEAQGPTPVEAIDVRTRELLFPLTNVQLWLGLKLGVMEPLPLFSGPGCGLLGCGSAEVSVITFGEAQITTSPGETFPETVVGRGEVTIDYGPPWGPRTFGAMEGLLPHYSRPTAMHFGLTNNFVGYLVPECDFLPEGHPENYCEYFAASRQGETLLRRALVELLDEVAGREG